jgi:large subunit ribosomal protein L32
MAVPKKKTTKSRQGMRRSHHALSSINVVDCPNCGANRLPHHLCSSCGQYNDRQILRKKTDSDDEATDTQ